jgi:biotin-dependent carboxylase-like uncharacterized protein
VLTVLAPGPRATVQDRGRTGWASIGVPCSGAADRAAHDLANRLVGNLPEAATVEVTAGGLRIRAERALLVAVTGAPAPLDVDGRPVATNAPLTLPAGAALAVGMPARGLRSYLAVRGGIAVAPVLHARATDILAGLGPPVLGPGTVLPIGTDALAYPTVDLAPEPAYPVEPVLRVVPGPRDDWLTDDALPALCSAPYEVTSESNRVGVRLVGPVLRRRDTRELPPEAMVTGALQVPPSGQPILFLADHPVTGGYPVIAVVIEEDLHLAAQARPGQRIRFRLDNGR